MMFSQLVEICRQLVESRTVIADSRRNIVANSSELGFNIVSYHSNSYASRSNSPELGFHIVSYRSNSYASRSNSPELGFNIVSYRSNSYAFRSNSCHVWEDADNAREPMTLLRDLYKTLRMSYEISTTYAPPTLDAELWR